MIASENKTEREKVQNLLAAARSALSRYGLHGAEVAPAEFGDEAMFNVEMPAMPMRVHPYLGRISGQSFLLRVRSGAGSEAVSQLEVELLAALLRDTDLDLPEPVAACDGSVVVRLPVEGLAEEAHCVLFRDAPQVGESMPWERWLDALTGEAMPIGEREMVGSHTA